VAALPADATLAPEMALRIRAVVAKAEATLWAEAGKKTVFVVTDKRFETRKLLYNFRELLRNGVYYSLPWSAFLDLQEGGKCIAFERPTAAAFHLLRGPRPFSATTTPAS
jgi:hypothetical protein